jgi:hypothetical protein
MGGRTHWLSLKFLDHFFLMQQEPACVEIAVIIEQFDEFF